MKFLKVNSLCGIKNQMYSMDQYVDSNMKHEIKDNFFDINSLFWSKIFDPKHVSEIISIASYRLANEQSPKIKAVIQKPEVFFETYLNSLNVLCTPSTEKELFQSLETLEIICCLHSKILSMPFALTLSNGFVHSQYSSLDLSNLCLLSHYNPYLKFIENEIIPKIIDYQPDILVLTGKPNIASFAIAKIIREKNPNIFIISAEHESDYYSMRKIRELLVKNDVFFSVYHCVVLNSTDDTIKKIMHTLFKEGNSNLSNIPNIIYSTDNGKTIINTMDAPTYNRYTYYESFLKDNVLNVKAFPQNHCYWNKCTFCGINSKYYGQQNNIWDVKSFVEQIKEWYAKGLKKIWLLDEAIPVDVIYDLSKELLNNNIHMKWHIRTRIEPQYTDPHIARMLKKAGLVHVLFGFETASNRVLQIARKNNNSFDYLDVAERIVQNFMNHGINVHFSAIIGFPSETIEEVNETSCFLRYMNDTYTNCSYNVNTYYLDIGSKMYSRWENYGISSLSYPCSPKYFLENHLDWNEMISPKKNSFVKTEQQLIMQYQYKWYPDGALISPSMFFSFWEHSRYCLNEKNLSSRTEQLIPIEISYYNIISLSKKVSCVHLDNEQWLLYNLKNHHYVIGGNIIKNIINFNNEKTFLQLINNYDEHHREPVISLIMELTRMEFFSRINEMEA